MRRAMTAATCCSWTMHTGVKYARVVTRYPGSLIRGKGFFKLVCCVARAVAAASLLVDDGLDLHPRSGLWEFL